jgi:hypothetical protein
MRVTRQMLEEAGVIVLKGCVLKSVEKDGPRITGLVLDYQGDLHIAAKVYIDGTYEGLKRKRSRNAPSGSRRSTRPARSGGSRRPIDYQAPSRSSSAGPSFWC